MACTNMKTVTLSFGILMALAVLSGCKKDEAKATTPTSTDNFSLSIDGKSVKGTAKYSIISGPTEILRISYTGSNDKLTMDLYRPAVNNFTIQPGAQNPNDASFNYTITSPATTYSGTSGTISVTSYDSVTVTGTFSVNTTTGSSSGIFATGSFTKVPKQ
jgi:uncharacterized lipoprotein YajG